VGLAGGEDVKEMVWGAWATWDEMVATTPALPEESMPTA